MTKVKICGLTNASDAIKAEELGADYLGFVFFRQSPRCVKGQAVAGISAQLRVKAEKIGLFFNQEENFVRETARSCGIKILQLHGEETPEFIDNLKPEFRVIKSFKIKKGFDFNVLKSYENADYFLFDTFKEGQPGGTGLVFDWSIVEGIKITKPLFLAGGLKPGNVKEAIKRIKPYAVDIASGVEERPGKKDHKLMEEFINAAK